MPTRKTATPTSTIAPTPTSCLYVRSIYRLPAPGSTFPSLACITAISRSRSRNCCTMGSLDAMISSAVPTARILAFDSNAIRSATRNAPRTSCVTTTLVTPISCCSRSISESMTSAFTGSRPDVGSSYSKYVGFPAIAREMPTRSEEHTSELQSHLNLVCRLLLEKKNKQQQNNIQQKKKKKKKYRKK